MMEYPFQPVHESIIALIQLQMSQAARQNAVLLKQAAAGVPAGSDRWKNS